MLRDAIKRFPAAGPFEEKADKRGEQQRNLIEVKS